MFRLLLLSLLSPFIMGCKPAAEVRISVLEVSTQKTTAYEFNVGSSALKPVEKVSGKVIQQTTRYTVEDGRLLTDRKKVSSATELLYQCHIDGYDLIVVRKEHNSFSNPLRILSAASGHPIQVSKIVILKIVNGKLKTETEIIQKPSSYKWEVSVLEWSNQALQPTPGSGFSSAARFTSTGPAWLSLGR